MLTRRSPLVAHAAAYLLFLGVAVVITWPLVTVFSTRFVGHPFHDAYEYARHIWWIKYALQTGQPLFEQPLLAYPDGLNGALLWSYPLQSFPAGLFSFVMPLPAAFNLTLLLRLAFDGWAAYWLARYLTGAYAPALVGGLVFMAYPTVQGQIGASHIGLLVLWPAPFYTYALLRLREGCHRISEGNLTSEEASGLTRRSAPTTNTFVSQRRWVAIAVFFVVASTWGSTQMLLFTIVPITLVFAVIWLAQRRWRAVGQMVVAFALGCIVALIWAVPLLRDTLSQPAYAQVESNIVDYSADLLAIAAPSFYNPLYSNFDLSRQLLGVDPFESAAYLGIAAGVLALIGVLAAVRRALMWLALAFISWVASLGPLLTVNNAPVTVNVAGYMSYITLPWAAVFNLPLVNITRTPARFNFMVGLAVAMLAAFGFAVLWRRLAHYRWRAVLVPVVMGLIVVDYQWFWTDMPTVPGVVPEPIAALAERDDVRAVFDVPWEHLVAAKEGMWLQTGHQRPLIAGHMTRVTPVDPAKLTVLQATLDLALLDQAGVDVIILHKEWDDAEGVLEASLRERLGEPFYEDERFATFDVPDPTEDTRFIAIPAPNDPILSRVESYVYLPEPARLHVTATVKNGGRDLTLFIDEQPGPGWSFDDTSTIEGWIDVSEGYHRLSLVASPPCPAIPSPALECRAVELSGLSIRVDDGEA